MYVRKQKIGTVVNRTANKTSLICTHPQQQIGVIHGEKCIVGALGPGNRLWNFSGVQDLGEQFREGSVT